jgi:hypothetical protein
MDKHSLCCLCVDFPKVYRKCTWSKMGFPKQKWDSYFSMNFGFSCKNRNGWEEQGTLPVETELHVMFSSVTTCVCNTKQKMNSMSCFLFFWVWTTKVNFVVSERTLKHTQPPTRTHTLTLERTLDLQTIHTPHVLLDIDKVPWALQEIGTSLPLWLHAYV